MQVGDLVKHVKDARTGLVVEQNYQTFLVKWIGKAGQVTPEGTWLYDVHVEVISGSR